MRQAFAFLVLSAPLLSGCASERFGLSPLSANPRDCLSLDTPILASVLDDRVDATDSNTLGALQAELTRVYGANLEWIPFWDVIPPDRVAVRFQIRALGASFGSKLMSPDGFPQAQQRTMRTDLGPWSWVVRSATSTTPNFVKSAATGWWYGTAWIDFELQDNRASPPIYFTFPLAAEEAKWNLWGYASGDEAAALAWENVAIQLTITLDNVLRVVRDSEK